MSNTPFMPLWVADFIKDTLDLEAKEIGAYMLLLMAMWGRNGYLPNDHAKLKRVARVGRDWPKVWASIEHYFTVEGDAITQDRLLKELTKVDTKRRVNAQSGARGGRAKALKTKEAGLANATVSLKQPEPEPYNTDTNVSDGQAVDATDIIWSRCKDWLVSQNVPERQARSIIGKWLQSSSPDELRQAFNEARAAKTGDPIPYITQILKPRDTGPTADEMRAVMDRALQRTRL